MYIMSNDMLKCLESDKIPIFNLNHDKSNIDLLTIRNVLKENGIVILKNYIYQRMATQKFFCIKMAYEIALHIYNTRRRLTLHE